MSKSFMRLVAGGPHCMKNDHWRIFEAVSTGVTVFNSNGDFLYANNAASAMLDLASAKVQGEGVCSYSSNPGIAKITEFVVNFIKNKNQEPIESTVCFTPEEGGEHWLLLRTQRFLREQDQNEAAIVVTLIGLTQEKHGEKSLTDITERKVAENSLERINRALKVLSESNQVLVRAIDEEQLLQDICRTVVEVGGYLMAWVGYAQNDPKKTVKPAARCGYDNGYLDSIWVSWDDVPEGQGPAGKAIRTGTEFIIIDVDIPKDDCFDSFRAKAEHHGYASAIGLPLFENGRAFGAITIYAKEKDAFDPEEVNLLKELANDLSYGILSLRAREDRKKAREALKLSQFALDQASDAVMWTNSKGRFIYVNESACRFLEYTSDELLFMKVGDIDSNMTEEAWPAHWEDIKTSGHRSLQTCLQTKSGRIFPVEINGNFLGYNGNEYNCVFIRDISERKRFEEELQFGLKRLRNAIEEVVEAMAMTVEIRDPYTAGHQRRVAQLVQAIALEMGLPQEQVDGVRLAAVIHDIGKIYTPAEILSKPGKITEIEMSMIRTHPKVGYNILKTIEFPWPIADAVLQHHERMNGSGYPHGLTADQIILEAKIIGVADVVEAMASHRPYRPALGTDKALQEIEQNRGIYYDPHVVDICLRLIREKGFEFDSDKDMEK